MQNQKGLTFLLLAASVVIIGAGIKLSASILIPLLLAGFIATVSFPLVTFLCKRGIPQSLGIVTVMILDIAVVAGVGWLLVSSIRTLYARIPQYSAQFSKLASSTNEMFSKYGVHLEEIFGEIGGDSSVLLENFGSVLKSFAGALSNVLLVLALVAFMLVEASGLTQKLKLIFKEAKQTRRFVKTISQVQKYLGVKTLSSLLTGVIAGLYCLVWSVDLPLLWGVLAFLFNYIPTIGSLVAAIPPTLLALVQWGPGVALGVGLGYAVFNVSIATVLEPRIMGKTLGLSPLVVFLSMVIWGWLLGPVGALLSVPLTVALRILLENTEDLRWFAVLLSPSSNHVEQKKQD